MSASNTYQFSPIKTPEELRRTPGYVDEYEPSLDPVEAIIWNYHFNTLYRCSISSCHKMHYDGWAVQLTSGQVTNIGGECWKNHFSEFGTLINVFREQQERPRLTAQLTVYKASSQNYSREIDRLRDDLSIYRERKLAMKQMYPAIYSELERGSNFGEYKVRIDREILKPDSVDKPPEKLTSEDYMYQSEIVAEISGCEFITTNSSALISEARAILEKIEKATLVKLSFNSLYEYCREGEKLEMLIQSARASLSAANRFFSVETEAAVGKLRSSRQVESEARKFNIASLSAGGKGFASTPSPTGGTKKLNKRQLRADRIAKAIRRKN